ncbi:hypothetical protein H5410_001174 [Solanum commersonii]|uniref:Uncharacterized protein n=1 Tax=Solanum commersonii TaxID=4109 RepID=A0A9J6AYH6_SOLCO|nr:hypothetical protein H5410_001174 [Solanum commersonii]
MNGFRYTQCARMIISMSTSTNYVELVELLHEKMGTNSENIHMDISGKYPCSIQVQINRSKCCISSKWSSWLSHEFIGSKLWLYHANQPHFVEPIVQPPFQQLSMHGHHHLVKGSSSQMRIDNSHRDYEARGKTTNLYFINFSVTI